MMTDPGRGTSGLTRGQATRAQQAFIIASGFWGVWSQAVGIGTAVFTGYALHLGADASYISLFTFVAYLLATVQLLMPVLGRYLRRKRVIISVGLVEIALRSSPPLVPLLFAPPMQLPTLMVLAGLGLLCGYSLSPFYNTWVASAVPGNIRGRFTSRQTIVSTLVSMIAGFAIGGFIDDFGAADRQVRFHIVFAVGAVFGWLGYVGLSRASYTDGNEERVDETDGLARLAEPFRDGNFLRAVLFFGFWTFGLGIAQPLYSVFMLDHLGISYKTIAVFNAAFMLTSILGYRLWASLVDRFGSKPVLQILILPATFLPVLWVCNAPGAYTMIPVALVLSGVLFSGIMVAVTPLLYGLAPAGGPRPYYLASWSATVNLMGALGALAGGILVRVLREVSFQIEDFPIGHLQIIMLLSAVARIPSVLLLGLVSDRSSISSRHLLSHLFGGNLLSYTFNTAVYTMARQEERRARAALALGRSGSPLAIEQLIQALADASPVVRRSAARALGETGSVQATDSLVRELLDGESDIRSEAAEALGRLGYLSGVDPLVEALEDEDPWVRISAIRGLSEIGGDEARELLFWYLGEHLDDPVAFPTLVDVLSRMGDHRVVRPTLQRLGRFRSEAVRLQLLNSVCYALGAGGEFYRLLSQEESQRPSSLARRLRRLENALAGSPALDLRVREEARMAIRSMVRAVDAENLDGLEESARQLAGILRDGLSATGRPPYEVLSVYLVIFALETFLASRGRSDLTAAREIFVIVCLGRMGRLVRELDSPGPSGSPRDRRGRPDRGG